MGKNSGRGRSGSNVIGFPTSKGEALKAYASSSVPVLKWRKASKTKPGPTGSKLPKVGLTEAEKLLQISGEGTIPERMLYGWLVRHNIEFSYQESVLGGRNPGGAVLDFVIYDSAVPIVIRVQSYWHMGAAAQWADDIQMENLLDLGYRVEDVDEGDLNTPEKVDKTMRGVLYGAK